MATSAPYPARLEFHSDLEIARWRPLAQWLLAIPHLVIAAVLSWLRGLLTLVSFFTVLFTKEIPRPLFDLTVMTLRYEWRAVSYAMFLHEDYPPFDFEPTAVDDGREPHTTVTVAYPEELARWLPLVKWLLAVPHYVVLAVLVFAALPAGIVAFFAVIITGAYPQGLRDFLVGVSRYNLRVQAYIGLLTDRYPPFTLSASA